MLGLVDRNVKSAVVLYNSHYHTAEVVPTPSPETRLELVEHPPPGLGDRTIWTHRFEPLVSETDDVKIDSCHFLAECPALLRKGKDW